MLDIERREPVASYALVTQPKKMCPNLIIHEAGGPDYLSDMVSYFLYTLELEGPCINTNKHPEYLFNDYPLSRPLYGKGFTLYRRLPPTLRKHVSVLDSNTIKKKIEEGFFKRIVWTSIRRSHEHLTTALAKGYRREQLIVFDGEDDTKIMQDNQGRPLTQMTTYYKRELTDFGIAIGALPVSFKFPHLHPALKDHSCEKTKVLAGSDPRFRSTYIFDDEDSYYLDYKQSLFAFTTKKAGWDCLRHYEIIACNCLPILQDLNSLPRNTMKEWSRELQHSANQLWGQVSSAHSVNASSFLCEWKELMCAMRKIFIEEMLTSHFARILDLDR